MTEVDKSVKLVFNEFQRSIAEVPLEVYYQELNSDQYNANGYQFNIKSPGTKALLDSEVWLRYDIDFLETGANSFKGGFVGNARGTGFPASIFKFGLRSGFVVQKATQNLMVQINNTTITVRPCQWLDALNRLYISNQQAEHEFCTSGGRFEEGNHGHRTKNMRYDVFDSNSAAVAGTILLAAANSLTNQITDAFIQQPSGYHNILVLLVNNVVDGGEAAAGNAGLNSALAHQNSRINGNILENWWLAADYPYPDKEWNFTMYRPVPDYEEFYNPGFSDRVGKFALKARISTTGGTHEALAPVQFGALGGTLTYRISVYERLAIPLFKMYSNDETFGVIPNITQMQIQGNFLSNFYENISRCNANLGGNFSVTWANVSNSNCKIYLRWYTPPMSMQIPREISVPYKKIVTWSKSVALTASSAVPAANTQGNSEAEINEYNISLEAIPDLLLLYVKYSVGNMTADTPDDMNLEITNLSLNIDNAAGKATQINSLDLYNKWKKLLKHSDNKIIGYDEWRKYCCVACLQPEDYGVRYGPGYSNPCVLGFKYVPINWWVNPAIGLSAQAARENLGGANGAGTAYEFCVTSIYYKNRLTIRADGTASQEMQKIAADFDMVKPDVGQGGMGAAGYGVQNA